MVGLEASRKDLVGYGIPLIILSTASTGLGMYLLDLGESEIGYPVFLISFGLTMLFIVLFIVPAVKGYIEDFTESYGEDIVGEN